jgi:2-oxo-3-hexenedioate decarboxylase
MISEKEIHAIARSIKAAQDDVQQIAPLTSQYSGLDAPSAYAVSRLIHEARLAEGAVPLGRKIGFTNSDMWPLYGVHEPVWGYVYDSTVVQLPQGHAKCSLKRFAEPKIEPEIVFHFRSAPPAGGDLVAILDSIDWVANAFEIVQSHYPAWKFRAPDTIADSALHGALLLGQPQPVDSIGPELLAALASFSLELLCNSTVRATGRGSNVLGSPLAAVAHLIAVLSKQPQFEPLGANELVTTGTITTAQQISPGQVWSTGLQGIALPCLSVEFTA